MATPLLDFSPSLATRLGRFFKEKTFPDDAPWLALWLENIYKDNRPGAAVDMLVKQLAAIVPPSLRPAWGQWVAAGLLDNILDRCRDDGDEVDRWKRAWSLAVGAGWLPPDSDVLTSWLAVAVGRRDPGLVTDDLLRAGADPNRWCQELHASCLQSVFSLAVPIRGDVWAAAGSDWGQRNATGQTLVHLLNAGGNMKVAMLNTVRLYAEVAPRLPPNLWDTPDARGRTARALMGQDLATAVSLMGRDMLAASIHRIESALHVARLDAVLPAPTAPFPVADRL